MLTASALLQYLAWIYLGAAALGIVLALKFAKGIKGKAIAALLVFALFSYWPVSSYLEVRQKAQIQQEKLNVAMARFEERCKRAGERITRTVENVDGVVLMKVRSRAANSGQFTLDDPYGKDCSVGSCIVDLLRAEEGEAEFPESAKRHAGGYRFVEAIDPGDGVLYRYSGALKPTSASTKDEFSKHVEDTGYGGQSDGSYFALRRERITKFAARYGIDWDDISTREDRELWIAGGSLKIIDLQTNEVVAERMGYLVDTGQGSTAGFRDPWGWAKSYAPRCPRNDSRTLEFSRSVLQPINR